MEKELEHQVPLRARLALEGADVLEALVPDMLAGEPGRQLLARQHLRMTRATSTSS